MVAAGRHRYSLEDDCGRASDAWGGLIVVSSAKATLESCERQKGGARQEPALREARVRPAEKQRDATKHHVERLRFVRQDVDLCESGVLQQASKLAGCIR